MIHLENTLSLSLNFTNLYSLKFIYICSMILNMTIFKLQCSIFYKLLNEVVMNINMIGTFMEDWIIFHHKNSLITKIVQQSGLVLLDLHIYKHPSKGTRKIQKKKVFPLSSNKSKVIIQIETNILQVGAQKDKQPNAYLVQNIEALGPLVGLYIVLRTVRENTSFVFLDQSNKVNKTLKAHPLPIEEDLVGTVILEESLDEGSMDNSPNKTPIINSNSKSIVSLYTK